MKRRASACRSLDVGSGKQYLCTFFLEMKAKKNEKISLSDKKIFGGEFCS
jgi:hypothetical protein